eukprot:COSAG01_NODE_12798_length_1683_cov_39.756313_2_plen_72_part_00
MGRFVWLAGGHDSIATFAIDPITGAIQRTGAVTLTGGQTPRNFQIHPNGQRADMNGVAIVARCALPKHACM